MTLKDATEGQALRVKKILGDGVTKRRLLDLGITAGAEISVRNIAPFGGTILISLRGYMLALRENIYKLIEVVPV